MTDQILLTTITDKTKVLHDANSTTSYVQLAQSNTGKKATEN